MKTILLIEDDEIMRENTADLLEQSGFRVLTAVNGREGVSIAMDEGPDIVLCDIMMPELDGYGVLHQLGSDPRTADIPLIFLSAKAELSDIRMGMSLGADDYLTKPYEKHELLQAIEVRLKRGEAFRKGFEPGYDGFNRFLEEARGVDALKDICRDRKTRVLSKKEVLFNEGDEMKAIPYIVSGKVRTFRINSDGKELATGLHGAGDFVGYMGLLESARALESAEALEECVVALIPRDDLFALLYRDRDVSMRFIKMLARDAKENEGHLMKLAYATVRQRVAQAVLRVHERFAGDSDSVLGVRITREDLASVAGTATESLIRCLADFKEEGLVSIQGRELRIADKARLEKLAAD
ncbi:MAG: response regulator [Flavobacteriales bacterium]